MMWGKVCLYILLALVVMIPVGFSVVGEKEEAKIINDTKPATAVPKHSGVLRQELKEKQNRIDSVFSRLYGQGYFNGCVAVLHHDTLLYQHSFGIESIKTKKKLTSSSVFQLASVSKIFTGVAMVKLLEEKKLSLKDKVTQYFPAFPYKGVTVEHLLMHKSGLPNYIYFCNQFAGSDSLPFTNTRVLELMQEYQPKAYGRAGERYLYCNTNYVFLALLVEKVSGMSFQEYVRKEIFEKCGMKHSSFFHPLDTLPGQTFPFNYKKQSVKTDRFDGITGDKGIYSTTTDLMLFSRALFSGKIIASLSMATKPRVHTHYGQFYGYGFRINPNQGDTIVFHNGWWHGYRTAFHYRKKDHTTLVILSNRLDRTVYQTTKLFDLLDKKSAAETNEIVEKEGE